MPAISRGAATQLLIIRTAMLLGLLVFGAVTWYSQRQHRMILLTDDKLRLFGFVFVAIAGAALGGLVFLRSRLARTTDAGRLVSMYIIGYALAEGAGLFGGVVWYLGGAREWFVAGLVLLVVAFQILPIARPR